MTAKLTSILCGACLAGALATAGLWARSQWVTDEYNWPAEPGEALVHSRAVFTTPGRVVFNERCAFT
jgi:hypothetical protein